MELRRFIQQFNPPCDKCPYKLGLVQTLINPCPQCKENGYQTFERFRRELSANDRQGRATTEMWSVFDIMSRDRDYYRKQRKRIIQKKRHHLAGCWFARGKPPGAFAKNKFHCPVNARQCKTTPKTGAYHYGDRKHNWSRRDARAMDRMRSQVLEWQRTNS